MRYIGFRPLLDSVEFNALPCYKISAQISFPFSSLYILIKFKIIVFEKFKVKGDVNLVKSSAY